VVTIRSKNWRGANLIKDATLLTYLLTPWCRMLFEKLIVTQLIKKYSA
jgi:hypothetical protein